MRILIFLFAIVGYILPSALLGQNCPTVIVESSKQVIEGESAIFTAKLNGGPFDMKPTYEWMTNAGKIASGGGTEKISVTTTSIASPSIKAYVTVNGIPGCPSLFANGETTIKSKETEAIKTANKNQQYQYFPDVGFKIKCVCELTLDKTAADSARKQGRTNFLGSYACVNDEDSNTTIIIVDVFDETASFAKFNSNTQTFEGMYVTMMENFTKSKSYSSERTIFNSRPALVYSWKAKEMSFKALTFIKNEKSYTLKVGSKDDVKNSFEYVQAWFDVL